MAVAKGLSSASNAPLVSLSTTELYANPLKLAQSVILPLIDAKKAFLYSSFQRWKKIIGR